MADTTVIVENNPTTISIESPASSIVMGGSLIPATTVVVESNSTTVVLTNPTPTVVTSATQGPPGPPGIVPLTWNLSQGSFDSSRYTIITLGDQVIDSFSYTQYGAAKYIIYATLGLQRQISEILLLQDSVAVQTVEYANMITGSLLGQYTAVINNGFVNLIVSPTSVGTSFQLIRTLINN